MIERSHDIKALITLMAQFPVTAILGPRQCGKTTLARLIKAEHYFDLENPRDAAKLSNPQLALEELKGTIVIDEIQRCPDLFPLLRYLTDTLKDQKYLILGSASGEMMKQSGESLAGRIAFHYLGGFRLDEIGAKNMKQLWLNGGFPLSFLAPTTEASFRWRENYITTFLERDIPQLGINIPAATIRRFWIMLSHYQGQVMNYAELSRSFGISDMTVRRYIDILSGTFMVRMLQPWFLNIGKRLVKSPKTYIRDSGIFHALLSVKNQDQLLSHNKLGASWEGYALEMAARAIGKRDEELFFWATHGGAELDLFWQDSGKNWGAEFKYSDVPRATKSMHAAIHDLDLAHLWVIYAGKEKYRLTEKITVLPLSEVVCPWTYSP